MKIPGNPRQQHHPPHLQRKSPQRGGEHAPELRPLRQMRRPLSHPSPAAGPTATTGTSASSPPATTTAATTTVGRSTTTAAAG